MTKESQLLFERAKSYLPGGVNSPVRAFKAVGGVPRFIDRAQGSRIYDVDGNEYIDYVASWGPMILGHAHPTIIQALEKVMVKGLSFGAPTALEVELATRLVEAFPAMELVRMVSSGTEAVMSAIRLARGYTLRDKIVKFEGCYHGHADSLLVKAGSGGMTFGIPDSLGVPADLSQHTIILPFNDSDRLDLLLEEMGGDIACIITEPIAGNMGVIPPMNGFLQRLRAGCDRYGIVLIFDEVITGFRVAYGGAQGLYGVSPDLTCLGKIIGGGLPIGAFGGKRQMMEGLAPCGEVYQAGTLSGHPLAMVAGLETLNLLSRAGCYEDLEEKAAALCQGMAERLDRCGWPFRINRVGSLFTLFFADSSVIDYRTARLADTNTFARYFHQMLRRGVYLAPSQFEALFLSTAHTWQDVETTLHAHGRSLQALGDVARRHGVTVSGQQGGARGDE